MSDAVTVKPISRREANPAGRGLGRLKWVFIGLGAAVILAAAGTIFFALEVYDKIYPGVTAAGIDLGGMTRSEAESALGVVFSLEYQDKKLSVTLDGESLEMTPAEAGVSMSAQGAAQAAYEAGRSGGFFARVGFVISCLNSRSEVDTAGEYYIDREAVERAVAAFAARLERQPADYSWTIGDAYIDVKGAAAGRGVDEGAIVSAMLDSFGRADFTPLSFQSRIIEPSPLPLDELYEQVRREPVSAYLDLNAEGGPAIMPHVNGVSFNVEAAKSLVDKGLPEFSIPLEVIAPEMTQQMLADNLFKDVLSEYKTDTKTSSQNRADNVSLSAAAIDGYIMLPGDVFSFNGVVGNRTSDKGYKMAGSYISGKYVEQIGGGICQTSSTLYNAVLLANLEIVYRQNHSLTIGYVPLGQDATVNWDNIDFQFSNNTGYPIMIQATHVNRELTFRVMGTKTDDTTVSMESVILSHTPYSVVTKENPSLAPGSRRVTAEGHHGYVVQTYRVIKAADGSVIARNPEARSYYGVINEVVEVGPGTPTGGEIPPDPIVDPSEPPEPPEPPDDTIAPPPSDIEEPDDPPVTIDPPVPPPQEVE